MSYLAWILKLALLVLVIVFLVKNTDTVTVRYYLGSEWQAPLFLVLSIFFLAGVVLGVVASLAQVIRQRREIAALKRELRVSGHRGVGGAERAAGAA
jgi:lipopolysaccharide assembly protein A